MGDTIKERKECGGGGGPGGDSQSGPFFIHAEHAADAYHWSVSDT